MSQIMVVSSPPEARRRPSELEHFALTAVADEKLPAAIGLPHAYRSNLTGRGH